MIDLSLTDAQREVQRTARAFAEREILPRIGELDGTATYDRVALREDGRGGFLGPPIPERYGGAGMDYIAFALPVRGDGAGRHRLPRHPQRPCRAELADAPAVGQRGPEAALPRAAGARREAGHLRPHRAGRRHGCRQPRHDCPPRRRSVHPQRLQDLDQPGRHRRPLPRLRHASTRPQGHSGITAFIVERGIARLQHRHASTASSGVHAGNTGELYFDDVRGAGGQPGRRGGRGLHDRDERHRPGPLHGGGRRASGWRRRAWTPASSTRTSGRRLARRSASTSWSSR